MLNKFDFKSYNNLMENASAGLKLSLAYNLLMDAGYSFHKFNNPLADDINTSCSDIRTIIAKHKTAQAQRKMDLA